MAQLKSWRILDSVIISHQSLSLSICISFRLNNWSCSSSIFKIKVRVFIRTVLLGSHSILKTLYLWLLSILKLAKSGSWRDIIITVLLSHFCPIQITWGYFILISYFIESPFRRRNFNIKVLDVSLRGWFIVSIWNILLFLTKIVLRIESYRKSLVFFFTIPILFFRGRKWIRLMVTFFGNIGIISCLWFKFS